MKNNNGIWTPVSASVTILTGRPSASADCGFHEIIIPPLHFRYQLVVDCGSALFIMSENIVTSTIVRSPALPVYKQARMQEPTQLWNWAGVTDRKRLVKVQVSNQKRDLPYKVMKSYCIILKKDHRLDKGKKRNPALRKPISDIFVQQKNEIVLWSVNHVNAVQFLIR